MNLQKWTIAGLLLLHIGWIGNHIRWVLNDQIDPWKLGGYAMYTVATPQLAIRVFEGGAVDPVDANFFQFELAMRFTNAVRAFRCAGIPPKAFRAFFDDNRDLIGKSLVFVFSQLRFYHHPPSTRRETQGVVSLTWQDADKFFYTSSFCGEEKQQSGTLS